MSNSNSNHLDDFESSDEEEKCEIRRGSGSLLDPYGVPIQNKRSAQRSNTFGMTSILSSSPAAVSSSPGSSYAPSMSDLNQKIRVCVRKRPLNKKELERGEKDISPTCGVRSINVNEPKYVGFKCTIHSDMTETSISLSKNEGGPDQIYRAA